MAINDWLQMSRARINEYGFFGAYISVQEGMIDAARRIGNRLPIGTNIYELDWDLLVLLDGCRTDSLRRVLPEFPREVRWDTIWSVGSQSAEWMGNTFVPKYYDNMAHTAYITGNPYTNNLLKASQFGLLDEVWSYAHDPELETVPPRPITDQAVRVCRNNDFNRVIVHYMQPHGPFIAPDANIKSSGFDPGEASSDNSGDVLNRDLWRNKLKYREIDYETVWADYMQTLRYVLNDVELLLNSTDAERAILSADHGNAFGELGAYGHPSGLPHPSIRRVPWAQTTATDNGKYEPTFNREDNNERDVDEILQDLGYIN